MPQSYTFTSINPPLVPPAKFKIRYRLLPSGDWSDYEEVDTFPYTIGDLEDGTYEAEVIYVTPEGDECSPAYKIFDIITPFTCGDFTAGIVTSKISLPYIEVGYTLASPVVNPPCGYVINWTNNNSGATGTISYASLSLSGTLKIYMPSVNYNDSVTVVVLADMCNGKYVTCYDNNLTAPAAPCDPMVLTSVDLLYVGPTASVPNAYYIRLTIANSNPTTPDYIVNYNETSPTGGFPPDMGVYHYKGAALAAPSVPLFFAFQVFPKSIYAPPANPDIPNYDACVQYKGVIVDVCGQAHAFCVTYPLDCLDCED